MAIPFSVPASPAAPENSQIFLAWGVTVPTEPSLFVEVIGGVDADLFAADRSESTQQLPDGTLRYTAQTSLGFRTAPDFEAPGDDGTDNVYNVRVRLTYNGESIEQDVAVRVQDLPEQPEITSNGGGATATVQVAENTVAVTKVTATDPDRPAQTLTYRISGGDDKGKFAIDSSSGALTFLTGPDFDSPGSAAGSNSYKVEVEASDGARVDTQLLTVIVTDLNDTAPEITSNGGGATGTASVAENTTAVTTVIAKDPDTTGTQTFSLIGGADQGKFTIDSKTGALSFLSAPDFETPGSAAGTNAYEVTVQVSDGVQSDTQALTVTVTDANDVAPTITSGGTTKVAENTPATTVIYQATATDPDSPGAITFSLTGADATLFSIGATDGKIRFLSSPDYENPRDAGGNNVYDVVLHANDGISDTTQAVAITVTNRTGEVWIGQIFNDTHTGTDEEDFQSGGAGNDTINGGRGNDLIFGEIGNDRLSGDDGNDTLIGGSGNDNLDGGAGNDNLSGELGDDLLTGGSGDDSMNGGQGRDTFVFLADFGKDVVSDFQVGSDVVQFSKSVFASFAAVQAATVNNGAGFAVITAGTDTVTLLGVSKAQMVAGDFKFV